MLLGQVCMHWPDQSSQEQTTLGKAETVRIGQVTVKLVLQHHTQKYFSSTIPHTATLQFHHTTYSNTYFSSTIPHTAMLQFHYTTYSNTSVPPHWSLHTALLQFHHTAYSNTSVPPQHTQQYFSSITTHTATLQFYNSIPHPSLPPSPYCL